MNGSQWYLVSNWSSCCLGEIHLNATEYTCMHLLLRFQWHWQRTHVLNFTYRPKTLANHGFPRLHIFALLIYASLCIFEKIQNFFEEKL